MSKVPFWSMQPLMCSFLILNFLVATIDQDQEVRIIRCKNLALYIRDCVSLRLSDETL